MPPLLLLAVAVILVLGLILALRLNAFFALITAALVVSFLSPGELSDKVSRVADAFGASAGKIGIPIAMAAIIGSCLMASGAAERIVQAILSRLGEKRSSVALAASGFTLSIPVFFDTVFFLLVPLGKSLYQRTGHSYLKYLLAIGVGGSIAHTLVPPTPGPLLVADQLGVEIGLMMLVGIVVGIPSLAVGLSVAAWLDKHVTLESLPSLDQSDGAPESDHDEKSAPGLLVSCLPVLLPIVLVGMQTVASRLAAGSPQYQSLAGFANVVGNPSFALLLAAAIALVIYVVHRRPTAAERLELINESLMSAGVIILITSAGGAFGAMLKAAQVGPAINNLFSDASANGTALLWLAFGIAGLLKFSQGSSTVAMITASAMIAAMIEGQPLDYNPVYLAQAIGCGALFGVWMNDSGFWLFCRMGGLTEWEGIRTWTTILALVALTGMLTTVALANLAPMAATAAP